MNSIINKNEKNKTIIPIVSAILTILIIWIIISSIYQNNLIFPKLSEIINSIGTIFTSIESQKIIIYDLIRIIITIMISFIIAFSITILYILWPRTYDYFRTINNFLKTIPVVIISIFLWLFVSKGALPIIITLLVIMPQITTGLISATSSINKDLLDEVRLLGGNRLTIIFKIYFPIIAPYILMTFLQSFGLGLKVMVTAEYLCQVDNSIGKELYILRSNLDTSMLIAYGVVLIIIVAIIEYLVKRLSTKSI